MKRGGGKDKGSAFERLVCKQLSLWVSHGRRSDLFWRSAMSGGRATVAQKKGLHVHQAGDITSVHQDGHALTAEVYIECKALRKISLDALLSNGGPLLTIWNDTRTKARKLGRVPVLIAKQNRLPTLFITSQAGRTLMLHTLQLMPLVIAPNYHLHAFKFDAVLATRYLGPSSSPLTSISPTTRAIATATRVLPKLVK